MQEQYNTFSADMSRCQDKLLVRTTIVDASVTVRAPQLCLPTKPKRQATGFRLRIVRTHKTRFFPLSVIQSHNHMSSSYFLKVERTAKTSVLPRCVFCAITRTRVHVTYTVSFFECARCQPLLQPFSLRMHDCNAASERFHTHGTLPLQRAESQDAYLIESHQACRACFAENFCNTQRMCHTTNHLYAPLIFTLLKFRHSFAACMLMLKMCTFLHAYEFGPFL
jgi:hypothetical protein